MKYISKNKGTKTGLEHKGNMIVKWTAEYGTDILEWYKENGLSIVLLNLRLMIYLLG
jgi:hypothetical protein